MLTKDILQSNKESIKIIKLAKCRWCGEEFIKQHNREEYCSDGHRKYARQEQNRQHRINHYHKYKDTMHEEQKYGLGTGYLSCNRQEKYEDELIMVEKEIRRLKIKI
jgi:hypothetical protein